MNPISTINDQTFTDIRFRLSQIYQAWEELSDEAKKDKINVILPFIQIISLIDFVEKSSKDYEQRLSQNLSPTLNLFNENYKRLFGHDLSSLATSDIEKGLQQKIKESQENNTPSSQETKIALASYHDKYIHAHSKIAFNFGRLFQTISQSNTELLSDISNEIRGSKNIGNLINNIKRLLNEFKIENHYQLIQKDIDDLENHALLNQMSNWQSNIYNIIPKILNDDSYKIIQETLRDETAIGTRKIYKEKPIADVETQLASFQNQLGNLGLKCDIGIETEFLLRTNPNTTSTDHNSAIKINHNIKKALADLRARLKKQKEYNTKTTLIEVDNYSTIMLDTSGIAVQDPEILLIQNHILQFLESGLNGQEIASDFKTEILEQVKNFTNSEIIFYKFLFMTNESLADTANINEKGPQIEIGSTYQMSSDIKTNLKNFIEIIHKGKFHEELLDMIQAYEIAFGPYGVDEIINKRNATFLKLHDLAQSQDTKVENPNAQINLSFIFQGQNILTPKVVSADKVTVQYNQLGIEILKVIQETIASSEKLRGHLRNQDQISIALDCKKTIGEALKETPYHTTRTLEPAFLMHREIAAKHPTLRLSAISDTVGVAELRIAGSNPHSARFDDSLRFDTSSLLTLPDLFLAEIGPKIIERLEQLEKLEEGRITKLSQEWVEVAHNGSIPGLEPIDLVPTTKLESRDAGKAFSRSNSTTSLRQHLR